MTRDPPETILLPYLRILSQLLLWRQRPTRNAISSSIAPTEEISTWVPCKRRYHQRSRASHKVSYRFHPLAPPVYTTSTFKKYSLLIPLRKSETIKIFTNFPPFSLVPLSATTSAFRHRRLGKAFLKRSDHTAESWQIHSCLVGLPTTCRGSFEKSLPQGHFYLNQPTTGNPMSGQYGSGHISKLPWKVMRSNGSNGSNT